MSASDQDQRMQRWIFAVPAFLTAVLFYALAGVYGAAIPRILHWTGVLLLLIGIALAARGISDVRRDWTHKPGISGPLREVVTPLGAVFWRCWNWMAHKMPIPHRGHDVRLQAEPGTATSTLPPVAPQTAEAPPTKGTLRERVTWLERQFTESNGLVASVVQQEAAERQRTVQAEQAHREARGRAIRASVANLAGGGLRLQAWGVACLLVGTVLSGFW